MDLKEHLIRAKAIIQDAENWGQGEDRACPCALDALRISEDMTDTDEVVIRATAALQNELPFFQIDESNWDHSVAQFNDLSTTTHADIMALYDRAIERATS